MGKEFEVRWEGEFAAPPEVVWDAITVHSVGYLWHIDFEPWAGGAEKGLTDNGGRVTVWDPTRHFTTRADTEDGFNQLDYRLEPRGNGTYLRYVHQGVLYENFDVELDACRKHTDFYRHSLGEYVRVFPMRDAVYVAADAPEVSKQAGFAVLRRALGVADVTVGDPVQLTVPGLSQVEGVVDYSTDAFLGIRSADALYRFYGRDVWGYPVSVAHHMFGPGVDKAAHEQTWSTFLNSVFTTETVA